MNSEKYVLGLTWQVSNCGIQKAISAVSMRSRTIRRRRGAVRVRRHGQVSAHAVLLKEGAETRLELANLKPGARLEL